MSDHQDEAQKKIYAAAEKVLNNVRYDEDTSKSYLSQFAAYECWLPYLKLTNNLTENKGLEDYIEDIKIMSLYLEDIDLVTKSCVELIRNLKIPFKDFSNFVLPRVIWKDDAKKTSRILYGIWPAFEKKTDQIQCLEMLTFILDKKLHAEQDLQKVIGKLLKIDKNNRKALKFLKAIHSQNEAWDEVSQILLSLLSSSKEKTNRFRYAQELASVYLYKLDLPQKALDLLKQECSQSPLDSTTITYDAFVRLKDWQGCLSILSHLLTVKDFESHKASLHFHIGQFYIKMQRFELALESIENALNINPNFFEAYEAAVQTALIQNNWFVVKKWLHKLKPNIKNSIQIDKLDDVLKKIDLLSKE